MILFFVWIGLDLKLGFLFLDIVFCGDFSIRLLFFVVIFLNFFMVWMIIGCGVEEVEEDIIKFFFLIFLRI